MTTETTTITDENTITEEYYQREITCRKRGAGQRLNRYHFTLDTPVEHIKAVLLEKEGFNFRVDELVNTGNLTTAHHKLYSKVILNQGVKRIPISNELFLVAMEIKYALNKGISFNSLMKDAPISPENKEVIYQLITRKDFLEKAEMIAYSKTTA